MEICRRRKHVSCRLIKRHTPLLAKSVDEAHTVAQSESGSAKRWQAKAGDGRRRRWQSTHEEVPQSAAGPAFRHPSHFQPSLAARTSGREFQYTFFLSALILSV